MGNLWKYIIIAVGFVLAAIVVAAAYTEGHKPAQGTISVTGLGETEFTSDLIVIEGHITVEAYEAADAYHNLERDRAKTVEFLASKGVNEETISFEMPNTNELFRSIYENGDYIGQQFAGYQITLSFTIESADVDTTESAARELPSLIAEGIDIHVFNPMYYYTGLEDVKLELLSAAAADARERAANIAKSSKSALGELKLSRAGVFQITAATGDEEFSAGGSFNLSSREKKARVTVRSEFFIDEK
ncbi:MAG: SIMPL domain-containing protein [Alistipes sp.]|nr:SIMPL domain-containing protein [Alistipes sp.]